MERTLHLGKSLKYKELEWDIQQYEREKEYKREAATRLAERINREVVQKLSE